MTPVLIVSYLTKQDVLEAFTVHRSRSFMVKWMRRLVPGFVMLLAFGILARYFWVRPSSETTASLWPALPVIAFWILYLFFFTRWNADRHYDKQPAAHGLSIVMFDDSGVHLHGEGGSSDLKWNQYVRWLEGENQILLYPSPLYFNVIPKRGISPERLTKIRGLLAENISKK